MAPVPPSSLSTFLSLCPTLYQTVSLTLLYSHSCFKPILNHNPNANPKVLLQHPFTMTEYGYVAGPIENKV